MDDEEAVKESEKKWTKPTMDKEREKKTVPHFEGGFFSCDARKIVTRTEDRWHGPIARSMITMLYCFLFERWIINLGNRATYKAPLVFTLQMGQAMKKKCGNCGRHNPERTPKPFHAR